MSVYHSDEYLTNHDYLQHYGKKGMKWGVVNELKDNFNKGLSTARNKTYTDDEKRQDAENFRNSRLRISEVYQAFLEDMPKEGAGKSSIEQLVNRMDELTPEFNNSAYKNKINKYKQQLLGDYKKKAKKYIHPSNLSEWKDIGKINAKKLGGAVKSTAIDAFDKQFGRHTRVKIHNASVDVQNAAKKTVKKAKANINKGVKDIKDEVNNKKKKVESFIGFILD